MAESILFLSLFSSASTLGTVFAADLIHYLAGQSEARSLSDLADAARAHAARNPMQLLESIAADPNNHVMFDADDLVGSGRLAPDSVLRTSRRREVELAAFRASAGAGEQRIVILAWAAEGQTGSRLVLPQPGPGITDVGRVGGGADGCAMNHICGPGLDWDAATFLGELGTAPPVGSMAAVRLVHLAADSEPYLHRIDVGDASLNRVEGDFDLHGRTLSGSTWTADWEIGELRTAGGITTAGGAEFAGAEIARRSAVGGDADFGGIVLAEVTVGSRATRPAILVAGSVVADELDVSDRLGEARWSGGSGATIEAEVVDVSGRLSLDAGFTVEDVWPPAGVLPASAPRLAATDVEIGGSLEVVATGPWGTGSIFAELADVSAEAKLGRSLTLDEGGIGFVDEIDATGCSGCGRILGPDS